MNDTDRSQWVDSDEGLYDLWRSSGQPRADFIRDNRAMIDEVAHNVRESLKPAHYLKYGG